MDARLPLTPKLGSGYWIHIASSFFCNVNVNGYLFWLLYRDFFSTFKIPITPKKGGVIVAITPGNRSDYPSDYPPITRVQIGLSS